MRRRVAAASLAVGLLHGPAGAWADPATPAATPDETVTPRELAKGLALQGTRDYRAQKYEAARDALSRAYTLDPQTETLLELGVTELEAGHAVEAYAHLRQYLGRTDATAANLDAVRTRWLPRAEARTVRLNLVVLPGTEEIRVDGRVPEAAPLAPTGPPTGTPLVSFVIAPGEHEVRVRWGASVRSRHVVASAGEIIELQFRQPDSLTATTAPDKARAGRSRARWITALGLGAAAVATAGVAIGFGVAYESHKSDANRAFQSVTSDSGCLPPNQAVACGPANQDRQAERTSGITANWLFAAAGALAVIGVATWFLWPSPPMTSAGAVRPVPLMGPQAAGAALTGAW